MLYIFCNAQLFKCAFMICLMTEVVQLRQIKIIKRTLSKNPFQNLDYWINLTNSNSQLTWEAGKNFQSSLPRNYIHALVGTKSPGDYPSMWNRIPPVRKYFTVNQMVPENFDARLKWPECRTIQMVKDQGQCGSCWAMAAVSVITDRMCISSEGKFQEQLSTEEPVSCCLTCGNGCDGGYVDKVWKFILDHGVVTGGDYNSSEGCQPYSKEPCEHNEENGARIKCSDLPMDTPRCRKFCSNFLYNLPFDKDHRRAGWIYRLPTDIFTIQLELINNGPIQAIYKVYEDFLSYKRGIYQQTSHSHNKFMGHHSVKLIGWGVDGTVPYWLAINSWNKDWGDKGTFKILRGYNECDFEEEMYAGLPSNK